MNAYVCYSICIGFYVVLWVIWSDRVEGVRFYVVIGFIFWLRVVTTVQYTYSFVYYN